MYKNDTYLHLFIDVAPVSVGDATQTGAETCSQSGNTVATAAIAVSSASTTAAAEHRTGGTSGSGMIGSGRRCRLVIVVITVVQQVSFEWCVEHVNVQIFERGRPALV